MGNLKATPRETPKGSRLGNHLERLFAPHTKEFPIAFSHTNTKTNLTTMHQPEGLEVGTSEGTTLGEKLGEFEGLALGTTLGNAEGSEEGELTGFCEGEMEGETEGTSHGELEGV